MIVQLGCDAAMTAIPQGACHACTTRPLPGQRPRDWNWVTATLAYHAASKCREPELIGRLPYNVPAVRGGVGTISTQLIRLLGLSSPGKCDCASVATQLNDATVRHVVSQIPLFARKMAMNYMPGATGALHVVHCIGASLILSLACVLRLIELTGVVSISRTQEAKRLSVEDAGATWVYNRYAKG